MSKNCDTCGHCIMQNSESSPGGLMFITNYKCENPESSHHGQVMNIIDGPHGEPMDARKKESCENWEDHATAREKRKREPILVAAKGAQGKGKEFPDEERKNAVVINGGGKKLEKKGINKVVKDLEKGKSVFVIRNGKVNIRGQEIEIPHYVKKGTPEFITIINDKIYINGYRYKDGLFYRNIFTRITRWL